MRTLIIEDEVSCCMILQQFLSPYGECVIAVNGKEGFKTFKAAYENSEPFDLICLDIMMPEMDGQEVLKLIRKWEKEIQVSENQKVKIIMTTALTDEENKSISMKEKCDVYIEKPIIKSRLIDEICSIGLIE